MVAAYKIANITKTPDNNIYIGNIKIINVYKTIGLILLSLLLSLKSFAEQTSNISANPTHNQMSAEMTKELLLAEFAINNNQPLKALEIYLKIAETTKDPQIAKRATELAIANSRDQEALRTIKIWADGDLTSSKAQLLASLLMMQYYDVADANEYIKRLLKISDVSDAQQYAYFELLFSHPLDKPGLKKLGELLESIVKMPEFNNNTNVLLAMSMYYEKAGIGKKSLEYIDKALQINNMLQIAHIQKIRLLNLYQSTASTLQYLENTIALFPDNHELRKLYADILYDLAKWPAAKAQYEILISQNIFIDESLLQLAYIYINTDDLKAAKKYLLKLSDNEIYGDMANYYLGILSQQLGLNEEALKYFNLTHEGEYYIRSKMRIATILVNQNKLKEAKEVLSSLIKEFKENDTTAYAKEIVLSEAELLYQQGMYTDSLIILDNIKHHYPNDPDIYYSIGILANKLNNSKLFEENMNFVITKNPNNSDALSALGWHYYKQQQHKKAYDLLAKAYEVDNYNSIKIGSRFAAILWKLGQKEKADAIWKKYLELDPNNQALRDMIKETKNNN